MYVVERKRMTKWYLKLFKRLLTSTVLNSVVYRKVMERNIEQLSYRIQLVERLFTEYTCAGDEQSVLGWHASNNTVPRLAERQFLRKVTIRTEKSKPQKVCSVFKVWKKETFSLLLSNM
jgi:hypothetical protein